MITPDAALGVLDMLDNLKKWFRRDRNVNSRPTEINSVPPPKSPKQTTKKTAKELATERGEPYVSVVALEVDPENLHQGAFELDWNDKFVADLVRAGYMIKKDDTDAEIVDRWFQNICRHVALETWEQEQAINPQRYIKERNIGDGRTEVS
jgi:hypothetical protein